MEIVLPLVCVFLCIAALANAGSLVGPGAVGSYQGGGGGRRYGGRVAVQEPPVGIFVGGSSLKPMNGIYGKVDRAPSGLRHQFYLIYQHDDTGWVMGLVASDNAIGSEWLLIDNDQEDRFRSEGGSYIPVAGERWKHIRGTKGTEPDPNAGTALAAEIRDDPEELPWQVIGIGEQNLLMKLRHHYRHYRHVVVQAIAGGNLASFRSSWFSSSETDPPPEFDGPAILDSMADVDPCQRDENLVIADSWSQAIIHRQIAMCKRWKREFEGAKKSIDAAFDLFPKFRKAHLEDGLLHMDEGHYQQAIEAFERVLRIDRNETNIDMWLVRAHTLKERSEQRSSGKDADHCIAWRQTASCDPSGRREAGYDATCQEPIKPGLSGYCECTGAHGTFKAAESRCEHELFTCADKCHEKWVQDGSQEADSKEESCVGSDAPSWCSPNHYIVLGVRCDFPTVDSEESEELKRAYKKKSLQVHPDKRGGSVQAFQRVAAAHEVLADPEKRRLWDEGEDIPRKERPDGSEGLSFKDTILHRYFPERFSFEPFGDPHDDRKQRQKHAQKRLERVRQEALARGHGSEL